MAVAALVAVAACIGLTMDISRFFTRDAVRVYVRKIITMAVTTLVFGWFYGWASPWAFPKEKPSDFKYDVLHGALMPLSLPSLVIGKDVPIYAALNTGRSYKIGYICGINACGLLFFGLAFRGPTLSKSNKSQ